MKEEQFKKIEECLQEAGGHGEDCPHSLRRAKDVLAAMYDEG